MNINSGGLAAAMGALGIEHARSAQVAPRAVAATSAHPAPKASGGFEAGLTHARAVTSPQKSESGQSAPNPNLPRGSLIDLRV